MPNDNALVSPPPSGDSEKSEKYLDQLINLINQGKLKVTHTDLKKFNIDSLQDHYRMDLGEYEVEVNHSKQPDSGEDYYVLLFNNLKKIEEGEENCVNKVILAYTHLTEIQFSDFKTNADDAIIKLKQEEERRRFKEAMAPIDDALAKIALASSEEPEEPARNASQSDAGGEIEAPKEEDSADSSEQNIDLEPKTSDYQSQTQPQNQFQALI